jgi:hypothetical protein
VTNIGKLAIIAVLSAGLVACGSGNNISNSESAIANSGGKDFATNLGAKFLSCSGEDSDKDGYVSCTVQPAASGGVTPPPMEILCGYKTAGCKLAKKA